MIADVLDIIQRVKTYVDTTETLNTEKEDLETENQRLKTENSIIKQSVTKDIKQQSDKFTKDMKEQSDKLDQQKMLVESLKTALSSIVGR